jgi:hypothetical protein
VLLVVQQLANWSAAEQAPRCPCSSSSSHGTLSAYGLNSCEFLPALPDTIGRRFKLQQLSSCACVVSVVQIGAAVGLPFPQWYEAGAAPLPSTVHGEWSFGEYAHNCAVHLAWTKGARQLACW